MTYFRSCLMVSLLWFQLQLRQSWKEKKLQWRLRIVYPCTKQFRLSQSRKKIATVFPEVIDCPWFLIPLALQAFPDVHGSLGIYLMPLAFWVFSWCPWLSGYFPDALGYPGIFLTPLVIWVFSWCPWLSGYFPDTLGYPGIFLSIFH